DPSVVKGGQRDGTVEEGGSHGVLQAEPGLQPVDRTVVDEGRQPAGPGHDLDSGDVVEPADRRAQLQGSVDGGVGGVAAGVELDVEARRVAGRGRGEGTVAAAVAVEGQEAQRALQLVGVGGEAPGGQ